MKKFISMVIVTIMMMVSTVANAQSQSNYSGSSKFTDNWNITFDAGAVSPFSDFYKNGSVTPIIGIGANKYVTPWLSLGVDARTSIGVGDNYNPHTAFDMVNVNGVVKFNVFNAFKYNGTRKTFEVNPFVMVGWSHVNCSAAPTLSGNYHSYGVPTENLSSFMRNSLAGRAGIEFALNLGKNKADGITLKLSDVWGNIDNMRLVKDNGHFEATLGWVHYFKTSNGTRAYAKPVLYDYDEVNLLNRRIKSLEDEVAKKPATATVVTRVIRDTVFISPKIQFLKGSAAIAPTSRATINSLADYIKDSKKSYDVLGFASIEGNADANIALSQERADAVKTALINAGVSESKLKAIGKGATTQFGDALEDNRIVIVENK